ncbi:hypothetical protein PR048_024580 [Dryococelus australis]|uniref:Uncharacterized protein n=1 Tax=Dryococelus australis TaxID=614101 RepID=A0ABQ9GNZ2_9NEOP|nr:hypothetical protein PR048_024580 [Dryococelus australis]
MGYLGNNQTRHPWGIFFFKGWIQRVRRNREQSIDFFLDEKESDVMREWNEVSMEQRRNTWAGETGDPGENPPTSGIVRHDSHMRKSGSDFAGKRTRYTYVGGDRITGPSRSQFIVRWHRDKLLTLVRKNAGSSPAILISVYHGIHLITPGGVMSEVSMEQRRRARGWGNGSYSRKPADQRHRTSRFPRANIWERHGRAFNPVHNDGKRAFASIAVCQSVRAAVSPSRHLRNPNCIAEKNVICDEATLNTTGPHLPGFVLERSAISRHEELVHPGSSSRLLVPGRLQVKKRGGDTGDTNTHALRLIAPTRKALFTSHQCELSSFPGRVNPGFPQAGIVPDNAAGLSVFLRDLPVAATYSTAYYNALADVVLSSVKDNAMGFYVDPYKMDNVTDKYRVRQIGTSSLSKLCLVFDWIGCSVSTVTSSLSGLCDCRVIVNKKSQGRTHEIYHCRTHAKMAEVIPVASFSAWDRSDADANLLQGLITYKLSILNGVVKGAENMTRSGDVTVFTNSATNITDITFTLYFSHLTFDVDFLGKGLLVKASGDAYGEITDLTTTIVMQTNYTNSSAVTASILQLSVDKIGLLAPHQGQPGSIPGRLTTGFSPVRIVPDDTACRRVFSGISRFSHLFIPALLHNHLASPPSALKTSIILGRGNRRSPIKPTEQLHRPSRFPRAKNWEIPGLKVNPVRIGGRRAVSKNERAFKSAQFAVSSLSTTLLSCCSKIKATIKSTNLISTAIMNVMSKLILRFFKSYVVDLMETNMVAVLTSALSTMTFDFS